jgi:hypothetical protein
VATNSLEFLLREVQQRLGLHATLPPPSFAAPPAALLAAAATDAAAPAVPAAPAAPAAPSAPAAPAAPADAAPPASPDGSIVANLGQRLSMAAGPSPGPQTRRAAAAAAATASTDTASAASAPPLTASKAPKPKAVCETPDWLSFAAHDVGLASAEKLPMLPPVPPTPEAQTTPMPDATAGAADAAAASAPASIQPDTVPRAEYGGAAAQAGADTTQPDTVPRAEYAAARTAEEVPPPPSAAASVASATRSRRATPAPSSILTVADVDEVLASEMGNARHQRRVSRKSFSRAVSHPRSPASLAASSGIAMDAKGALSGLTSQGGADARAAAPPQLSVLDDAGARRATVTSDGTVFGADGLTVRAYINENGEVGDAALEYLGAVAPPKDGGDNQGVILDKEDEVVGHVDYGQGLLKDAQGSTVAELRKGGELRGHWGMTCGTLEGFDFHKMQTAAAYIMLVDRALVTGK